MSTRLRSAALLGALTVSVACAGAPPGADPAPVESPRAAVPASSEAPAVANPTALTGPQVVEQICSQCHSMDPPPLAAPPLTRIARHLRQTFTTEDEAVAHLLAYLPAPDRERSILPAMAHDRFGTMPPQPLPQPLLEAAARYLWTLGAAADGVMGRGPGMGMGSGMGTGPRRGGGGGA